MHKTRIVVLGLAAALALTTVGITQSAQAGTTAPRYSGDDLVSGLIYGLGPVAEQYPRIALGSGHMVNREASTAFLPTLFAETERRAPGFRTKFADAVYSGDRLRIKETAIVTMKVLGDALVALIPTLEPLLRKYNSDSTGQATWFYENSAVAADEYAVIEFYGVAALAGVVTVVLTAIDFTPILVAPTSSDEARLQLEIWADVVARTLSPR
jgi:SdpC family antimicrobial peptide